jgi:4-amino-4-deoxy-L-arabinose transferase-like glycosyltransferase
MNQMAFNKTPVRIILLLIGSAMIVFSIAVPNESYARFLLGEYEKDLSWGPNLFRALLALHGVALIIVGWTREASTSVVNDRASDTETRLSPRVISILVILSVIALALRLWNLNSDLWIDEVLTLLDFVRNPLGQILTSFPSQNQHMLFSIMANTSTALFGESAWSLRLPSVLFGIGSIWAFFFLCRQLLGEREALLGSVLMTVSYHHIWFSQNARGYMGLLLFTLLASWCWFEALRNNEWRWWLGYSASIILGMWVHPTMAFVVAAHGLIYLVMLASPRMSGDPSGEASPERRSGLRPIAAWLLSVTVTLQLYALALPEFLAVGLHEESKDSEWTNPIWVVTESLNGLSIGFAGMAVVLCGGAFVAFGWFSLLKKNRRAALVMVLPALLAGGTMFALGHNLWPRFFFFSMGFGLIIVIHGAMELPSAVSKYFKPLRENRSIASYAGVGSVLILILGSLATVPKNYALPKQNYSGAKEYVELHSSPSDERVAVSLAGVVYSRYLTPYWPVAATGRDLEILQQGNDNVWLVYTIPIELKAFRPDIWEVIERDFEVVKVFPGTLNGGEVFVCQKKSMTLAASPSPEIKTASTDTGSVQTNKDASK